MSPSYKQRLRWHLVPWMRWDGPLFGVVWLRVKRDRDIPTGNIWWIFEVAPSLENQWTRSSVPLRHHEGRVSLREAELLSMGAWWRRWSGREHRWWCAGGLHSQLWVQAVEWAMAGWERERNRDDGPRAKQGGATKEMDVEGVEIVKGWRPVCGWVTVQSFAKTLHKHHIYV